MAAVRLRCIRRPSRSLPTRQDRHRHARGHPPARPIPPAVVAAPRRRRRALAAFGAEPAGAAPAAGWSPFASFLDGASFSTIEQVGLGFALLVSVFALVYAWFLAKHVLAAEKGTAGMQAIAQAVRDGSDAYLRRQFTTVGILLVFLTILIVLTKWPWEGNNADGDLKVIATSRGMAFLLGALFSATVGFVGHAPGDGRQPARGRRRPRPASATAMQLGYRTGTITGMLTDGLGLLGGTLIFMVYGEHAYEIAARLRLRRHAAGPVHAGRRRHLHQGGRRRRRPGRQGRGGHPRGRPPQRRHHRRQRRRQRRRLRRHGGRHLRELRGDDRRGDDPGLRQLRPQGHDLPAAGPGHRRRRRARSAPPWSAGRKRPEGPAGRCGPSTTASASGPG